MVLFTYEIEHLKCYQYVTLMAFRGQKKEEL